MNIYVGGVNGVGKSTILRRLAQTDKSYEVIHIASALMQELGLNVGDYDGLHDIPDAKRDAAMAHLIGSLAERQTTKVRLLDGHYLNTVWGTVHYVVQDWISRVDALVLIEADAKVIWQRINQDQYTRDRELFSKDASDTEHFSELSNYIVTTHHEFDRLVAKYQKDHFVLTHNDNEVDRAASRLDNFVQTIKA